MHEARRRPTRRNPRTLHAMGRANQPIRLQSSSLVRRARRLVLLTAQIPTHTQDDDLTVEMAAPEQLTQTEKSGHDPSFSSSEGPSLAGSGRIAPEPAVGRYHRSVRSRLGFSVIVGPGYCGTGASVTRPRRNRPLSARLRFRLELILLGAAVMIALAPMDSEGRQPVS
jgi:hypothetical protein